MKTEQRLKELGIELAPASGPLANYVNAVRTGNLLYLAGKGPGLPGQPMPSGKVGRDFTIEQGYEYARQTGLSLIAVMKAELGHQPEVINGCSDLFVEVFGERGKHARSAVGLGSLPRGIPVEIEVIVEVEGGTAAAPARQVAAKPAAAKKAAAPKSKAAPKK